MLAQERASRILGAWVSGSTERLERELHEVLAHAPRNAPGSSLEDEEQQVLESIASDLWAALARPHANTSNRFQSDFALLQHLSERLEAGYVSGHCAA